VRPSKPDSNVNTLHSASIPSTPCHLLMSH
jgi:hypothetical protein